MRSEGTFNSLKQAESSPGLICRHPSTEPLSADLTWATIFPQFKEKVPESLTFRHLLPHELLRVNVFILTEKSAATREVSMSTLEVRHGICLGSLNFPPGKAGAGISLPRNRLLPELSLS